MYKDVESPTTRIIGYIDDTKNLISEIKIKTIDIKMKVLCIKVTLGFS